jgi:hypothetical protein
MDVWVALNFKKRTHYLLFRTKNRLESNISIRCANKQIAEMSNIKFLGLHIAPPMLSPPYCGDRVCVLLRY